MYKSTEHLELSKKIAKQLSEIRELKDIDLIKENELGALSFKSDSDFLNEILDLFLKTNGVDFFNIPYSFCVNFNNQLESAIVYFNSIKNFNINQQNPSASKDSIINNLRSNYDSYYSKTLPILSLIELKQGGYHEKVNAVNDILSDLEAERKDSTNKINKYIEEVKEIVENTKNASLKVAVSNFSSIFLSESGIHKEEAKYWLGNVIKVLIVIGIVGIISLSYIIFGNELDNSKAIQIGISKAILLTCLFYLLNICNKNYKSHKHNEIINKHRYNALNTFETFVKSSNDEQTKNAVLLEATRTIFCSPQTGYLNNENESDVSTKIIEIFKDSNQGK